MASSCGGDIVLLHCVLSFSYALDWGQGSLSYIFVNLLLVFLCDTQSDTELPYIPSDHFVRDTPVKVVSVLMSAKPLRTLFPNRLQIFRVLFLSWYLYRIPRTILYCSALGNFLSVRFDPTFRLAGGSHILVVNVSGLVNSDNFIYPYPISRIPSAHSVHLVLPLRRRKVRVRWHFCTPFLIM